MCIYNTKDFHGSKECVKNKRDFDIFYVFGQQNARQPVRNEWIS